ncbi:MAG: hypothetical protein KAS18_05110, partial [Calditrichia bacterium]|nr:hypothetical protein [Calditrichia bacterium]
MTGVINILFKKFTSPPPVIKIDKIEDFSGDWHKNLSALYSNSELVIDHVEELEKRLNSNIPIALFPGNQIDLELKLFIIHPIKKRLGLFFNEKISSKILDKRKLAPIYIIQNEKPLGGSVTAEVLKSYIYYSADAELKLLFDYGICRIVSSKQHSVGIHFYEVGTEVIDVLKDIKKYSGIMISFGDHSAMMTDIVDIDRFHIGRVSNVLAAKILGVPLKSGYVQLVPAGLRFALAYPTPVQTGKDFSKTLRSFRYKKLCDSLGEDRVLQIIKEDAEKKGTPINTVLKTLDQSTSHKSDITYSSINGIYSDRLPWAGVMAKINIDLPEKKWGFSVLNTKEKPKTVLSFVEEFNKSTGKKVRVAWNGGYILNPELVGKLGIPETFIGSPLGLIISDKKILSPPLYNKPAFIVMPDGDLKIQRVNCSQGITISDSKNTIVFLPDSYNTSIPTDDPCFYDLLYKEDYFAGNGRILVRLSGNTIKEIIVTETNTEIPVLPVGLTLSFPRNRFPKTWKIDKELTITMTGWDEIESAIEAGPQLLNDGNICIDMEIEGWKTQNS